MPAILTNCPNGYLENRRGIVAILKIDNHLPSDSELSVVIVPHNSPDNVEDTCLGRCRF